MSSLFKFLISIFLVGIFFLIQNYSYRAFLAQISNFGEREKLLGKEISFLKEKIGFLLENASEEEKKIKELEGKLEKEKEIFEDFNQRIFNLEKKIGENRKIEGEIKEEKFCQIKELENSKAKREVIFNEICWMGDEDSSTNEWIELKNFSDREINLAGWQILNKDQKIKIILEERKILPGGFLTLYRGDDFSGAIKNSEESLFLFDKDCNLHDKVEATSTWPAGDSKTKRTMERKGDLTWQTSKDPGGTPGKENSKGFILPEEKKEGEEIKPKIFLNYPPEVFSQEEFEISLLISDLPYDTYDLKISILKISDESEQKRTISEVSLNREEWQDSSRYLAKVFTGSDFSGKIKLRIPQEFSGNAQILIRIRNQNKKIVAETQEQITIKNHKEIVTIPFEDQSIREVSPSVSIKILINEIQIAGENSDDEFIELYNPTDQVINLENWRLTRKTASGAEYTILSSRTAVKFSGIILPHNFFLIAHQNSSFAPIANILYSTQSLASNNTLILYEPSGLIIDKVGWGNVVDFEFQPFSQNPPPSQSLERINFQDTDNNLEDFQINPKPTPKT